METKSRPSARFPCPSCSGQGYTLALFDAASERMVSCQVCELGEVSFRRETPYEWALRVASDLEVTRRRDDSEQVTEVVRWLAANGHQQLAMVVAVDFWLSGMDGPLVARWDDWGTNVIAAARAIADSHYHDTMGVRRAS
jgi:hypothetical protein